MRIRRWLSQLTVAFLLSMPCACSNGESGSCTRDEDCGSGHRCVQGACLVQSDSGLEPAADDETSNPGDLDGGDGGTGESDSPSDSQPGWLIQPGLGVGPLKVSLGQNQMHPLSEVQQTIGSSGISTTSEFIRSFLDDTLWVGGMDINSNQTYESSDPVLSLMIRSGSSSKTAEGLGSGSGRSEVLAFATFLVLDQSVLLPASGSFPGGRVDSYFQAGAFIGYDQLDVVTAMTVSRSYQQAPDALINPGAGTLNFGGRVLTCGDGFQTGSTRSTHLQILGEPDWAWGLDKEVTLTPGQPITVRLYGASFRILGMEFVGVEKMEQTPVDKLVAIAVYPMFYGKTAAGHGVGSSKADWEQELGAPDHTKQDPQYQGLLFVYRVQSRLFAIVYSNDGSTQEDKSGFLILNYQEQL
jgi:hypothetical protein